MSLKKCRIGVSSTGPVYFASLVPSVDEFCLVTGKIPVDISQNTGEQKPGREKSGERLHVE